MFLNRIVLIGRLTNDPEERFGNDGTEISKFRIAVNRRPAAGSGGGGGGDRERERAEADFFNVVCFRHSAKFVNQYLRRGNLVAVEGKLQIDEYTDREGVRKQWIEVLADNVQNLTPRGEASGGGDDRGERPPARSGGGGGGGRNWEHDRDFAEDEPAGPPRARESRDDRPAAGGGGGGGGRRQEFPRPVEDEPRRGAPPAKPAAPAAGGGFDDDDDDPFADE